MNKYDIRQLRTARESIKIRDIILDYISFRTETFSELLNRVKEVIVNPMNIKNAFKDKVEYRGMTTVFGLGGIHGANKAGVYSEGNGMVIVSSDVSSFYPNLAIKNRWSPAHIPKDIFCQLYEWFYEERKKLPKKDPKNYAYKIILNSVYGLSNERNSFLYDPQLTMQITVNGQLSLAMLYEMVCESIPEAFPLMQNTDGVEFLIPEDKEKLYRLICEQWESITGLTLEHTRYQKLILADVNNYIAIGLDKEISEQEYIEKSRTAPHNKYTKVSDGRYYMAEVKAKGRFEFNDLALHKNKSFLIIPKAIHAYFVYGTPVEDFIRSSREIYDFCAGNKTRGVWKFWEVIGEGEDRKIKTLKGIVRYYVCKEGCKIVKYNPDDEREINLVAGKWKLCLFSKTEKKDWDSYDIDYEYYITKAQEEINNILGIVIPKVRKVRQKKVIVSPLESHP